MTTRKWSWYKDDIIDNITLEDHPSEYEAIFEDFDDEMEFWFIWWRRYEDLDDDETRMIFHEDFDLMDELSAHQTHEFNEDDLTGDIDLGLHIFTMMNLDIIRWEKYKRFLCCSFSRRFFNF